MEALRRGLRSAFDAYAKINKKITQEILDAVAAVDDPSRLADTIAAYMPLGIDVKQKLLETLEVRSRLEKLFGHVRGEIEINQTEERIKGRVKRQMEKTQREYYLNEQMRAIQKEMGEKDDFKSELEELEKRIKRKKLTTEAATKVRGEFKKLKFMSPHECRGHGGQKLHRLDPVAPVVRKDQGQDRHRGGGPNSGRGPLQLGKAQGTASWSTWRSSPSSRRSRDRFSASWALRGSERLPLAPAPSQGP